MNEKKKWRNMKAFCNILKLKNEWTQSTQHFPQRFLGSNFQYDVFEVNSLLSVCCVFFFGFFILYRFWKVKSQKELDFFSFKINKTRLKKRRWKAFFRRHISISLWRRSSESERCRGSGALQTNYKQHSIVRKSKQDHGGKSQKTRPFKLQNFSR